MPADVQGFDKLKVNDKIDIDYMQSVAVGFLPPGTKPSMTEHAATGPGMAGRQVTPDQAADQSFGLRAAASARPN